MIIVAKFESNCLACGNLIRRGERVNWEKGRRGVEHELCTPAGKANASRAALSRAKESSFEVVAPAGLSYLPYQRAGIEYMLAREGVINGDEMGLGKTVQFAGVINAAALRSGLVICPKSLTVNWERELIRWVVADATVARVDPKREAWKRADFVIASYEQAKHAKIRPVLEARQWDIVGLDEAHRVKNKSRAIPKAKRTKKADGTEGPKRTAVQRTEAARALLARGARRVLLTGTPFESRPSELWPLLNIADPVTWPNFFTYAKRYCGAYQREIRIKGGKTKMVWDFSGSSNSEELQEKLRASCMVRRLKKDVLMELPPKRRQIVELEINDEREVSIAEKALAGGEDFEAAAERLVGSPAAFSGAGAQRVAIGRAKAEAVAEFVKELLAGGSGPVLVGAWHHGVMDEIANWLGPDLRVAKISGDDSAVRRQQTVDAFQAGRLDVVIGQIDAAGVGLNMQNGSTVVFAELAWNPGQVSQFEDRCHRMGQANSVNVYWCVVQNSLEAYIAKKVLAKQAVADAVLDAPPMARPVAEQSHTSMPPREEKQSKGDGAGRPRIEFLPEQIAQIHRGLQIVAGVCNGARTEDGTGFAKIDVEIGHSLARAETLSQRQAAVGLRLVRKYKRQLAGFYALESLLAIGKAAE